MKGQSLIELALYLPVALSLALGTVAIVEVADAQSGLDAATTAATATAARASDPATAAVAAQARFGAVIAAYPVTSARLTLSLGGFQRGAGINGEAVGYVDLGWALLPGLPRRLALHARVAEALQPWRSHS